MTATEKFFKAACDAGIFQDIVNGMIITRMVYSQNDNTRKALSAVLQEQLVKNPNVLKAFNDFAREAAYETVTEKLLDAAKKKQGVLNNDPEVFIKILFKG